MSRTFHLGDILSVTTGKFVTLRGIDGLYAILNYLTDDNLYTHQLPRAAEECRPYLVEHFPWLATIDASAVTSDTWRSWLDTQIALYGAYHELEPMPPAQHVVINPISELMQMTSAPIAVVEHANYHNDGN